MIGNVAKVRPMFRSSFGGSNERRFEEIPLGIGQVT